MLVESLTDIGLRRECNQDAFYCNVEKGLFLLADGMGGYAGGEVASQLAVAVIRDHFDRVDENSYRQTLTELIALANQEICAAAVRDRSLHNMGSTLLALAVAGSRFYLAHVGDSRGYLLRGSRFRRLTEDHNVSGEMLREGQITAKEAMHHPGKHLLTRALGRVGTVQADIAAFELKHNDTILLCSDGLSGIVADNEIKKILRSAGDDLNMALHELLEIALTRGGEDNITMIAIKNN